MASTTADHDVSDREYFTLGDLERGFALVVGEARARKIREAWAQVFASCVVGDRVVALPASYGKKVLDERARSCATELTTAPAELGSLHGRRLIRFAPGTLTLVAAANPTARRRFDRLEIPYGWATIDDPAQLREMINFLREP